MHSHQSNLVKPFGWLLACGFLLTLFVAVCGASTFDLDTLVLEVPRLYLVGSGLGNSSYCYRVELIYDASIEAFRLRGVVGCGVYALHKEIKTTWFYVGEPGTQENGYISNEASAWDDLWLEHYGGVDDPDHRNGYYPAGFIPHENPFYVALPFNDLDEKGNLKPIARKIPWYSDETFQKNGSVLKNRWVEIEKNGKVAYAQWEDVGPFGEDDFSYVFGESAPSNPVNGAGIDVSPAVRDYLGLSDVDTVNWRFVDDADVPPGPWKEIVTTRPVSFR